jgi:hypothetical protein
MQDLVIGPARVDPHDQLLADQVRERGLRGRGGCRGQMREEREERREGREDGGHASRLREV